MTLKIKQKIGSFHSKHEKSNQTAEQYLIVSLLNTASWSDYSLSRHPAEEITVFVIRLAQVVAQVIPLPLLSATLKNVLQILISKNVYIRFFLLFKKYGKKHIKLIILTILTV